MTTNELRETKDYKQAVEKITNYPKGFTFTIQYVLMPQAKRNALKIIIGDCIENGLIEKLVMIYKVI